MERTISERTLVRVSLGFLVTVTVASCADRLPGGAYGPSAAGSINRANHAVLRGSLERDGLPAMLDVQFWELAEIEGSTYLVVLAGRGGRQTFLHLLVDSEDDSIRRLGAGGYRHAVLRGLRWHWEDRAGVEEIVYRGIASISD